jgi:hypothetical protein
MAAPAWSAAQPAPVVISPYRSSTVRSRVSMVLVGIVTATLALLGLELFRGAEMFSHGASDELFDQAIDLQLQVQELTGLYLLAMIASVVAFLAWLSRAVDNTPALGGGQPDFTPRASIGWWFVPFANLVQGYRIVADLWRRMAGSADEQSTTLVLAWWLTWLATNIATGFLGQSVEPTIEGVQRGFTITGAFYLVGAVSGVLLIRVIAVIERRARARAAHYAGQAQAPVQPSPAWPPAPAATAGDAAPQDHDPGGPPLPPPPPAAG